MDNLIYHYTTLEVFINLFNSFSDEKRSLTFWASNCAFMNDPQEIKEGFKLLKDSIVGFECPLVEQEIKRLLEHEHLHEILLLMSTKLNEGIPYAISFSHNKDNINMWNMYGDNGRGVVLGFDRSILESKFENNLSECYYYDPEKKGLSPIIQEAISLYIEKMHPCPDGFDKSIYLDIQLVRLISCLASNIKNISYEYENEIRLIKHEKVPKFRSKKNLILPYTMIDIPIEALKSITLGPNYDERTIQSIKMILWSLGLEPLDENIFISKVPYRN